MYDVKDAQNIFLFGFRTQVRGGAGSQRTRRLRRCWPEHPAPGLYTEQHAPCGSKQLTRTAEPGAVMVMGGTGKSKAAAACVLTPRFPCVRSFTRPLPCSSEVASPPALGSSTMSSRLPSSSSPSTASSGCAGRGLGGQHGSCTYGPLAAGPSYRRLVMMVLMRQSRAAAAGTRSWRSRRSRSVARSSGACSVGDWHHRQRLRGCGHIAAQQRRNGPAGAAWQQRTYMLAAPWPETCRCPLRWRGCGGKRCAAHRSLSGMSTRRGVARRSPADQRRLPSNSPGRVATPAHAHTALGICACRHAGPAALDADSSWAALRLPGGDLEAAGRLVLGPALCAGLADRVLLLRTSCCRGR